MWVKRRVRPEPGFARREAESGCPARAEGGGPWGDPGVPHVEMRERFGLEGVPVSIDFVRRS
jgi:hypothetical protein